MTNAEYDVLDWASHMVGCGIAGMFTGRRLRRRDAKRCAAQGWLEPQWLRVVDGDGFTVEPERERFGYVLTEQGSAALAAERDRRQDKENPQTR